MSQKSEPSPQIGLLCFFSSGSSLLIASVLCLWAHNNCFQGRSFNLREREGGKEGAVLWETAPEGEVRRIRTYSLTVFLHSSSHYCTKNLWQFELFVSLQRSRSRLPGVLIAEKKGVLGFPWTMLSSPRMLCGMGASKSVPRSQPCVWWSSEMPHQSALTRLTDPA